MCPIYEYECEAGHHTDKLRKFPERDDEVDCPCGNTMHRIVSRTHCPPDGVYSHCENLGSADRFERQRAAIKSGTKVIERVSNIPREARDGQLSPRDRE